MEGRSHRQFLQVLGDAGQFALAFRTEAPAKPCGICAVSCWPPISLALVERDAKPPREAHHSVKRVCQPTEFQIPTSTSHFAHTRRQLASESSPGLPDTEACTVYRPWTAPARWSVLRRPMSGPP